MENIEKKVQQIIILQIIKRSFIMLTSPMIISSFFVLLLNFPVAGYNQWMEKQLGAIWTTILPDMYLSFNSLITMYIVLVVAYHTSDYLKTSQILMSISTIFCFFTLLPITKLSAGGAMNLDYLNSNNLFFGMFCGMFFPYFMVKISKIIPKGQPIKDIPLEVSQSFSVLLPLLVAILLCLSCRIALQFSSYEAITDIFTDFFQRPLAQVGGSIVTLTIINFLIALFWFFGFNGTYIFNSILIPIYAAASIENIDALSAGQPLPNIITSTFQSIFINYGGSGSTLALIFAIMLVSKTNSEKQMSKLALIPGIFNINEPIVYGLPLVLNFKYAIPFVCCPVINTLIAYGTMSLGIVNKTSGIQLPWTTPIFISGFLASGFSGFFLQLGLFILNCLIYLPFVLRCQKE